MWENLAPLINKSRLSRTNTAVKHNEAAHSQLWLKATSLSAAAICCLTSVYFLASVSTKRLQTTCITWNLHLLMLHEADQVITLLCMAASLRLPAQSLGTGGYLQLKLQPLETQPSDPHPRPAGVHRLLLLKAEGRKPISLMSLLWMTCWRPHTCRSRVLSRGPPSCTPTLRSSTLNWVLEGGMVC